MDLHFREPLWLIGLGLIPLIGSFFKSSLRHEHRLEAFIDKHLIPYLLLDQGQKKSRALSFMYWAFAISFLFIALAGPRFSFRDVETFHSGKSLVVILDLSESMNAKDVKPSRLGAAKQKIEDLLREKKGVKLGLIAFARDPHMITPLTDDYETMRRLLPSINTDLVYAQGSRLDPALKMAKQMLEAEPGNQKSILILSDGGFEDSSAFKTAREIADARISIQAIGFGTLAGIPLMDKKGNVIKQNGAAVLTRLEEEKMQQLVSIEEQQSGAPAVVSKARIWDEAFAYFLIPVLPIFLWWFRKGTLFALLFLSPFFELSANCFKNSEQQAEEALLSGDAETASSLFTDPYRKGVAYYRTNDFAKAEEMFRQNTRQEVEIDALYNLGNACALQLTKEKLEAAILAYTDVLERAPDHKKAEENREIVKKMLEEMPPEENKQEENKQEENKQEENKQEENKQEEPEQSPPEEQRKNDSAQNGPAKEKSQAEHDADLWLDRIEDDPKQCLKNKFYLESKKNGPKAEVNPW